MSHHVRRITLCMDNETPIKTRGCCSSSEQTVYDEAVALSQRCSDIVSKKLAFNKQDNDFIRFELKVLQCISALVREPEGKYKDYLQGRVTIWNQKIEHIHRFLGR